MNWESHSDYYARNAYLIEKRLFEDTGIIYEPTEFLKRLKIENKPLQTYGQTIIWRYPPDFLRYIDEETNRALSFLEVNPNSTYSDGKVYFFIQNGTFLYRREIDEFGRKVSQLPYIKIHFESDRPELVAYALLIGRAVLENFKEKYPFDMKTNYNNFYPNYNIPGGQFHLVVFYVPIEIAYSVIRDMTTFFEERNLPKSLSYQREYIGESEKYPVYDIEDDGKRWKYERDNYKGFFVLKVPLD